MMKWRPKAEIVGIPSVTMDLQARTDTVVFCRRFMPPPFGRRIPLISYVRFLQIVLAAMLVVPRTNAAVLPSPVTAVPVSDIENWTGFKSAPAGVQIAEPLASKAADEMEGRLRKGLPDLIGSLKSLVRNPPAIGRDFQDQFEGLRQPVVAYWTANGEHGTAYAALKEGGGIKLNIAPDDPSLLIGVTNKVVKIPPVDLLEKFWGGAPAYKPRLEWGRWHWHGGDQYGDDPRTNIFVSYRQFDRFAAAGSQPNEAWIETGASFDVWKVLNHKNMIAKQRQLTKREAEATVVWQCGDPNGRNRTITYFPPGEYFPISILGAKRNDLGWTVDVLVARGNDQKIFQDTLQDGDRLSMCYNWADVPANSDFAAATPFAQIRRWPEYKAASKIEEDFIQSSAGVRALTSQIISKIRFAETTDGMDFRLSRGSPGTGSAEYIKHTASGDIETPYSFRYVLEGGRPRVTSASFLLKSTGQEPSIFVPDSWTRFATTSFEQVFGVKPQPYHQPQPAKMSPEMFSAHHAEWSLDFFAKPGQVPMDTGESFAITQKEDCLQYSWDAGISPSVLDKFLREAGAGAIDTNPKDAAMIAVKAAHVFAPEMSIENWRVRVDLKIKSTYNASILRTSDPGAVWEVVMGIPHDHEGSPEIREVISVATQKVIYFEVTDVPSVE